MSDRSKIEWTDATWNPVRGCSKISPGCEHCYAIRNAHRFNGPGLPFHGIVSSDPLNWTGELVPVPAQLDKPLSWQRPRMIFVNSMSDLFHGRVPVDYIADVFAVMFLAERHTFQILTKRAERMQSLLTDAHFQDRVIQALGIRAGTLWGQGYKDLAMSEVDQFNSRDRDWWPLKNVWLGVSVEDQQYAAARIPELLATPAVARFLSLEPLLGPIDLTGASVDWVIVGGESGPDARPMHPEWVRSSLRLCQDQNIPFFFKQWGEWGNPPIDDAIVPSMRIDLQGRDLNGLSGLWDDSDAIVWRIGKKAAGRLLDGREWNEFPSAASNPHTVEQTIEAP